MEEIWKDIPGYEGVYQASTEGRIKRVAGVVNYIDGRIRRFKEEIKSPTIRVSGTANVSLYLGNVGKTWRVDDVIAMTFMTLPEEDYEIIHKNFDESDNRLCNLECRKVAWAEEKWADITGYEGLYKISSTGRVLSVYPSLPHKVVVLQNRHYSSGYEHITLVNGKHSKDFLVHSLVARTFIPNPENKPSIDHIDTNKHNNNVSNLRWCTHRENMNNPLTRKRASDSHIGLMTGSKNKKSRPVVQMDLNGTIIAKYDCMTDAKRATGAWHISDCCRGVASESAGYIWRYLDNTTDPQ